MVYSASVLIDAPPDAVWRVLTDLDAYPEWNPFTPAVKGDLEVGSPITLTAVMSSGPVDQVETVRAVEPNERLVWGVTIGAHWLLHAERVQTLTPEGGGTRYRTDDAIGGLLSPVVHLLHGRSLHDGFTAMAEALAVRVVEVQRGLPKTPVQ